MANNNDAFTAMLLPQMMAQTQAMQQMAMRPQKSYATTTTTSTSTPYALADMIARRDSIGNASRALEDALKKREDLGYVLASSLGAIPQQQGYGSWLTDFARSLGGGMATPTNLEVDRAQKKYEADMADLQQALAFDKAMGETQTQKQTENIGYTGGGVAGGQGGVMMGNQQVPVTTKEDWDYWVKNWDMDRPTEKDYRGSEWGQQFQDWRVRRGGGNAVENPTREDYSRFVSMNLLPMARNVLKGSGPITDFEDRKYTAWASEVHNPVQGKDLIIRIIADVGNKNGWSDAQKRYAAEQMGVLSSVNDLTPGQIKQNPWRVDNMPTTREVAGEKPQAQDSNGWKTLSNGIRIRKI